MAEHKQNAEADRPNRRTVLGIAAVLLLSCGMVILLADRKKPDTVAFVLEPTGKGQEGLDANGAYDPDTGEFKLKLTNFRPPAGKDYELWMLRGNRAPKSLGLVSGLGMVKGNAPGAAGFSISLEPKGGATPKGGPPTGAVVCAGNLAPSPSQAKAFDPIVGKVEQGADLIGKAPPPLDVHWLDGEPNDEGKVRIVRWWTNGCPLCSNTAPAIAALKTKYGDRLSVRAIYHDKQRGRELSDEQIRAYAKTAGYSTGLARDDGWAALKKWWLDTGGRKFTSVTFVLGKRGKIRLIHTGGEFHARRHTDRCLYDPGQCAAEYAAIDAAIAALLAE